MALSLTYRGFNYVDYFNGEYSQNDTLPQVAETGADSVALTPDFGIDVATSTVYAGSDTTDTTADLTLAIQDATAQGLSVFIRPLVDILYPQVSPNNGAPNYYVPNSFTGDVGLTDDGTITATAYNPSVDTQYNGDLPSTNPATVPSTIPAGTPTSGLVNYRGELETTDQMGGDLNATTFFSSYDTMIVDEAKAAEAALPTGGSALFAIGTELDALATDPALTSDWDTLIADVRAAAPDLKLTYSANWSSAAEVTFWNKLDYVSIDGYVPLDGDQDLTATDNPSVATLEQGWTTVSSVPIPYSTETVSQTLLQELQDGTAANGQPYLSGAAAAPTAIDAFDLLAEKAGTTTGKLIFSEIGYQNDTSAAFDPTGSNNQKTLDPQLQANLYSAFFDAWGAAQQTANGDGGDVDGIPFALVGAYLWDWNPDTNANMYDDWSPDGYPAESVINSNFTSPITVVAETGEASQGGREGVPTAARGSVLTGDTDANGATLSISAISGGTVGESFATKYGSITIDSNGTYAYFVGSAVADAPDGSAPTDTITFTVADTNGATNISTLTITDYRNPTAVSETGSVEAGQTLTATAGTSGTGALAGDSDPDGASLGVAVLSSLGEPESGPVAGSYGTLTLNTNGSYTYVADSTAALASAFAADDGAPLTDSFTLIVEAPLTAFALSTLTVSVTEAPVNPITVVAETGQASQGRPGGGVPTAASGNALTGDTDANGATLSISTISGGTVGESFATKYGSITLDANGSYTYAVGAALAGAPDGSAPTDTITFTVADTNGATNTGTLTITDYRNPTTVSETGSVEEGQTLTATAGTTGTGALAGDSDPDGAGLGVAVLSSLDTIETGPVTGSYGTLTVNANGSYTYVADSSAALASAFAADHGAPLTDSFSLFVNAPLTASALSTLTITVTANPITVVGETGQASQGRPGGGVPTAASGNALTGDTDANGATLSISAISGGTVGESFATKYGSITLDANGSYTYAVGAALAGAPDGSAPTDTITFTVADTNGATNTGTLTITDYRNPTIVSETGSVEEGQTLTATAGTTGTGALAGDSDPDGAGLGVAVLSSLDTIETGPVTGSYGTLTVNANGSYTYVADSSAALASAFAADHGAPLTDSFSLFVNAPLTASALSTLTITVTEAPASGESVPEDFYSNSASAIPLQNTDGQIFFLQEAGAGGNVGNYGAGWNMVGADSFYTDGNTDILLQNTDGQMYLLDMQGNSVVGGGNVGNDGAAWDVVGTGGFFSDGDQGIALQNTDGQIYLLDMQDGNVVGGDNIGNYGSAWHVAATGDFFGDGNTDLVLQNTDGDIYLFDVRDTVVASSNVGNFGADWTVVGAGKFLSDGNTDLVLQNTDGQIGLMDVQDGNYVGFTDIGNFGASWQVKQVGDFFADGHSGIALQNTNGQIFLMELNGGTVSQSANLGNYGTSWHVPMLPG